MSIITQTTVSGSQGLLVNKIIHGKINVPVSFAIIFIDPHLDTNAEIFLNDDAEIYIL